MIAPSLHAELTRRGVTLKTTPDGRALKVIAPAGALDDATRSTMREARDELTQFVYELEECAAVLEFEQGNDPARARELARDCVRGARATPDGELWLAAYARNHPDFQAVSKFFAGRGHPLEIISAKRAGRSPKAA